jgi:hypothetical protein
MAQQGSNSTEKMEVRQEKKKKIRKFWVHVFYDFPFSTSSASSISLPSLTISSTRIFPSVATKYRK